MPLASSRSACVSTVLTSLLVVMLPAQAQDPAPNGQNSLASEPKGNTSNAKPNKSAGTASFDILAFNVVGNTLLPVNEIEDAVYPFLGPDKTVADAEGARSALEKVYQDHGYLSVVVSLPPQSSQNGEFTLEVIQAQVDKLKITGSRYHLPSAIRAQTPSLASGQIPNFTDVQADLARVQSTPDLQVTPLITAADDPHKIDVELKAQDNLPLHGSIEANSKQSYNTRRGRLEAGISYDNLFQRGHVVGLNWIYSPWSPSQANTLLFNYSLPVRRQLASSEGDDRLSFIASHSNNSTPTSLGGETVAQGDTVGLRYRMPLPGLPSGFSHAWTVGADYKNNRDANRNVGGFTTTNPALRYPTLVLSYDLFDRTDDGATTTFEATWTVGTTGLSGRTVDCAGVTLDQFECKRAGASPSFHTARLALSQRQAIYRKWDLNLKAQAQFATGPLVSAEQFGAGGMDTVRGYYEYEQVGDQGWSLRSELLSPVLFTVGNGSVTGLLFFDRASLQTSDPLPTEKSHVQMASYGMGLRLQNGSGLQAGLSYAVPVFNTVKPDSNGSPIAATGKASHTSRQWDLSLRQSF